MLQSLQSMLRAKPYTSFAFFVPADRQPADFARRLRSLSPYGNIPYTHAPALDGSGYFFALSVDEFSHGREVQRLGQEAGVSMLMEKRPWLDNEAALEAQMLALAGQIFQRSGRHAANTWQALRRFVSGSEHAGETAPRVLH